jgi:predicted phage terminase large subunit-like protein
MQKQGELLNQATDSKEAIEELQMEIGAFAFSSQYQQSPVSVKKGIIKAKWLNYYDELPEGGYIYQSWDSAIKADKSHDFSVCTTWMVSNNQYFLMDLLKVQVDYPELKRLFYRQAEQFSPYKILVEDKASGQQLIQEMRNSKHNVIPIHPKYDKMTRLILTSPLFEAGKFYLPRAAPWLEDMELELLSFPNCEHDDQVDSISQFLSYIMKQNAEEEYMVTMRRL